MVHLRKRPVGTFPIDVYRFSVSQNYILDIQHGVVTQSLPGGQSTEAHLLILTFHHHQRFTLMSENHYVGPEMFPPVIEGHFAVHKGKRNPALSVKKSDKTLTHFFFSGKSDFFFTKRVPNHLHNLQN